MPVFHVNVSGLATGAVANTFISVLSMKFANTLGHRARLRRLVLGGAGGAAQDVQVDLRVGRGDNSTDGTSTSVNVNTIAKADAASVASNVAAIGRNHTVEATTKENGYLAGGSLNSRGTLVLEWPDPAKAPVWGPNQRLNIEAAPGAASAVNLSASVEWEEF